ncbi:MAG: hypothetical protein LBT00_10170 [Spirochaetaceae bacterium]|nr:hypothetical protein [Spirochaetaceae bacterium]
MNAPGSSLRGGGNLPLVKQSSRGAIVIARSEATKQSSRGAWLPGLPRYARNDRRAAMTGRG